MEKKTAEGVLHMMYQKQYEATKPGQIFPTPPSVSQGYVIDAMEQYSSLQSTHRIKIKTGI